MEFQVIKSELKNVESMRRLFLNACQFQFVYNKCHGAGWSDIYLFTHGGEPGISWSEKSKQILYSHAHNQFPHYKG